MAAIQMEDLNAIRTVSPTSPNTTLSGDTLPGSDGINASPTIANGTDTPFASAPPIDLEAQDVRVRRPSVFESMRRFSSSLSDRIPEHWKAGHLNEHRKHIPLDEYPDGFPRFAAFMNCDDNFLMTRRYGWLHNRVMLFRQSKLQQLESDLINLDKDNQQYDKDALIDHKSFGSGEHGEYRTNLIQDIDNELKKYGQCTAVGGHY